MYCPKCGTKNDNNSIYCIKCRNKLKNDLICPKCQTENPPIAEYCYKCGTKIDPLENVENKIPYMAFSVAAVFLAILGVIAGTIGGAVFLGLLAVGFYFRQKIAFGAAMILMGGFLMLNAPLATPSMTIFNLLIGLFGLISLGILIVEVKEKYNRQK